MAAPERRTFSLFEAASIIGVSKQTLMKWLNEGCPAVTKGDRSRGIDWEISVADVFEWRRARDVEEAAAKYQDKSGVMNAEGFRRRKAAAEAVIAEIEAEEALRRVVDVGFVRETVEGQYAAARTNLGSVGAKVAGRASAMKSPAQIKELVDQEIREALRTLDAAAVVGADKPAERR